MALRPDIYAPQSGEKRHGRGFTAQEIKEAGIALADARWMAIPIDKRRKTHYPGNVAILKDYMNRIKKLEKRPKVTKAKAPAKERAPSKPAPALIETDLSDLPGVTKKLAETLVTVGIPSIRVLATSAPRRIAKLAGVKRDRMEKIIDTAKQYVREKARVARKEKTKKPQITELKQLPDITRSDVKVLKDLGVDTLEELKSENARDLALLSGIPEKRIKAWIKEIRSL